MKHGAVELNNQTVCDIVSIYSHKFQIGVCHEGS